MTNYGNGYKFQAIMQRRSSKSEITVQRMKKNGEWGKPYATPLFGKETPEQAIERLIENNPGQTYRIAQ